MLLGLVAAAPTNLPEWSVKVHSVRVMRGGPDGKGSYNEGYVFTTDGGLVPARVVHAPWLSKPQANGEDVALVLESEIGTVEIGGEIPDNTTALVIDVP